MMKPKRRNATEPVIRHLKSDDRLGRNFLKGRRGDAINQNRRLCSWIERLAS